MPLEKMNQTKHNDLAHRVVYCKIAVSLKYEGLGFIRLNKYSNVK